MTNVEAIRLLKELREHRHDAFGFCLDNAIEALKKENYCEQVMWERDIALSQLEQIGKGLGETMDDVVEALENCPSKKSLCYGCHDNCKKCELMAMAMI